MSGAKSTSGAASSAGRQAGAVQGSWSLKRNQDGLIPLLICILLVVGAIIYFTYIKVAQAQH